MHDACLQTLQPFFQSLNPEPIPSDTGQAVGEDMPVVTVAPNNELLDKLKSNLHEVRARGGQLFVFADCNANFSNEEGITVIDMPPVPKSLEAIIYTLPLQMLSYHVALLKGTDVDQPRNLAKSVTVE